jgi:hypothetical protein
MIEVPIAAVRLRPPNHVMRLARLGSFHQTRLSFMRTMLRDLHQARWSFHRRMWQVDTRGEGVAVYVAVGPERTYSLVAYAHDLDPSLRTDRVIAQAWDATFVLVDGEATGADIERLRAQVPKQEGGRYTAREIVLSRANRSVRLFDHVVDRLAAGEQPESGVLDAVGYLMRTTAVYGNGKFGLADRDAIAERDELSAPFRAEMLSVWLIRAFTIDIAEHLAAVRAPAQAAPLAPLLRRRLGIGNATGLGMAPFLVNHPVLLNNWILARETALARVRAVPSVDAEHQARFRQLLQRSRAGVERWRVDDPIQAARTAALGRDLTRLARRIDRAVALAPDRPWNRLMEWAEEELGLEAQEMLVTLLLEPYGDLVDGLSATMAANEAETFAIDGAMSIHKAMALVACNYSWALAGDDERAGASARFWYVSSEKLEPRLGERDREPGAERELPLNIGGAARALATALRTYRRPDLSLAHFLSDHPEHRLMIRRVQLSANHPYAEIRDNLVADDMRPIDLLRCKLSFFGAANFDPKSDRWTRITMFQHAPQPNEFPFFHPDDWIYPPLPDEAPCGAR